MKRYKRILMAIIIGTQTFSVANAAAVSVTIEGEPEFSKDTGGRFTAIVRRQADKLQINPKIFKYSWDKEGKRQASFELEPKDQQVVTVTLRRNDEIDAAISCTIKCQVTYSRDTKLPLARLPITMTNLPPKP